MDGGGKEKKEYRLEHHLHEKEILSQARPGKVSKLSRGCQAKCTVVCLRGFFAWF